MSEASGRYDKFTERARRVLVLAQQEAQRFNHNYIGTEHLLLGLVAEGEGIAAKVLRNLGVELTRVREAVLFHIGRGDKPVTADISLTPRAKRAMELAVDEAQRLHHSYIGTEHLLLGLIREGEGIAAGLLRSLGVTLEQAREQVIRVLTSSATPGEGGHVARPRDNVVTCRVDDQTLNALDALVEVGVHNTRSEAAARLIAAGIDANKALFDKVFAAVAEIRRVRAETQALAQQWREGKAEAAGQETPPGGAPRQEAQQGQGGQGGQADSGSAPAAGDPPPPPPQG